MSDTKSTDQKTKLEDCDTPILIVDDNPQYATLLKRILESAYGYNNITTSDTTSVAYEMIRSEPERFAMIFVDFRFPSGDTGGALLQRLKQESLMGEKVAFLVTSEPSSENVKQALAAGACGVIAKPFDRNALRTQIERARRLREAEEQDYF